MQKFFKILFIFENFQYLCLQTEVNACEMHVTNDNRANVLRRFRNNVLMTFQNSQLLANASIDCEVMRVCINGMQMENDKVNETHSH